MKKFANLEEYLSKENRDEFILYYKELEEIIGQELCNSAYTYNRYWESGSTHTLSNLVKKYGYKIEPDLKNKRLRFIRIGK